MPDMKITPITDYKEFHRTKDLPGCDKDILLAEVTERGNPEILSFLPDTDPERMAVQSSELCNHIIYYNMRQLLKLPTLGIIDQKQKYCSIYNSPGVMRNFFKGGAVKMVTYRTVAETVILYGLTAEELRTISRWCCTFSIEDKNSRPLDFGDLTNFYNKKALSRLIGKHIDPAISGIFPPRILKGMEYPTYADFLHVFRSAGYDPYEALCIFAHRKVNSLEKIGTSGPMLNAFELEYLDDSAPSPVPRPVVEMPDMKDPVQAEQNLPDELDNEPRSEDKPAEAETPKGPVAAELPLAAKNVESAFAELLNKAILPMTKKAPCYLVENIRALRKGTPGAENAEMFDALLLSSGCSNLDVFNYLARISVSYRVPLYALFYYQIVPGWFPPQKEFTAVEHKLSEIEKVVNRGLDNSEPITDLNLFESIAARSPAFFNSNRFGEPWSDSNPALIALVKKKSHTPQIQPLLNPGKQKPAVERPAPVEESKAAPVVTDQTMPITESPDKPAKKEITMTVNIVVRICRPCAADAWENDNPDKTKPGFSWDNATEEELKAAQHCVDEMLTDGRFNLPSLKDRMSWVLKNPFKAKVSLSGNGIKANIEVS
jgi:hypothetical protein